MWGLPWSWVTCHQSHVVTNFTHDQSPLRRSPGPVNPSSGDTGGDKSQSLQILSQFSGVGESGNKGRVHQQLELLLDMA